VVIPDELTIIKVLLTRRFLSITNPLIHAFFDRFLAADCADDAIRG